MMVEYEVLLRNNTTSLKKVMQWCEEANLEYNRRQFKFFYKELCCIEFMMPREGITDDSYRIKDFVGVHPPKSTKELFWWEW